MRIRLNPTRQLTVVLGGSLVLAACAGPASSPTGPVPAQPAAELQPAAGVTAQGGSPWGPETPPFNLEVVLRGDGFGLVRFRQPNDDAAIVYLDTWLRDLAPHTAYRLQRAVDGVLDGVCTGSAWLTLGQGTTPRAIVTDDRGQGREQLWRDLGAFPPGAGFDIHFRVTEDTTQAVVLESGCYRFRISL